MNLKNVIKAGNSKGKLANACLMYQRALSHYANESNWAVRGDEILWVGDDDPTYAAAVSLGQRKPDANYKPKKSVREPDKQNGDTSHVNNS